MTTIHPSVARASADELIAAGWGDLPRHLIPANWRTEPGPKEAPTPRPPAPRLPRGRPKGVKALLPPMRERRHLVAAQFAGKNKRERRKAALEMHAERMREREATERAQAQRARMLHARAVGERRATA